MKGFVVLAADSDLIGDGSWSRGFGSLMGTEIANFDGIAIGMTDRLSAAAASTA